jgi:hypothetical protein
LEENGELNKVEIKYFPALITYKFRKREALGFEKN